MATISIEQLEKLGLQTNESRVYLALLELGKGSVSQISKLAQLNRTTSYDILEGISLYGLASRSVSNKKQLYIAEPPNRLRAYVESKKRKLEESAKKLDELLPDLQSLYKTEVKPAIKFFEGRTGIKNIYDHSLDAKSTIYSILDLSEYLPEFDSFGKEHIRDRVKRNVKEKVLARYSQKKAYQSNTEYHWLDYDFKLTQAAEVMIYDDKVIGVLVKPGENVAFEIQSQSFANSLKPLFEIAWKQSKPVESKNKKPA